MWPILIWLTLVVAAASDDSWTVYEEKPCCEHHHLRHHRESREFGREFACSETLYYRTMYMDTKNDALYVGAMDRIFKLNLSDISQSHCDKNHLLIESSNVAQCVSKGKTDDFDCHNHIRVIQPIDENRLYICGTNAHHPKDWVLYMNLTQLQRHEYFPGVGSGIAKCPYDPADNSTAIWVNHGNPSDLPALYSGTNGEFTRADPVIFRTDLYDLNTGMKKYSFKRTLKYDSKWLDKTNFVGSFDSGLYVFFFFRETAVEYMNCGKAVYSRIARVCKKDTGGKHILNHNWSTYLKARLNCSIPGEFPFYFDEIQSVYQMPNDSSKFYAVFTTGSSDGLVGSAICIFTMNSIQEAFAGKFKEQASSSAAWLPVLRNRVPEPRPGTCVENTESLPDSVLNFIRSHSLMDEAVRQEFDTPVFYKRDIIFTHLVVDQKVVEFSPNKHYNIFYAGTNNGEVYKIVQWATPEGSSQWNLVDIWRVAPGEPIRNLQINSKHLFVATDKRIRQLPLVVCTRRYDSCIRCVLDPYCGWDTYKNDCKPYKPKFLQDASNTTKHLCENFVKSKNLTVTYGQSVHLSIFSIMPEVFKAHPITWYHLSKGQGRYPIEYNSDRIIQTNEKGLVILSVTENDVGTYECLLGPTLLAKYRINVDSHRCTYPSKVHDYKKIYTDWCHEFEKYKSAMRIWEKKQNHCIKQNTEQNLISNEIQPNLR